MHITTKTVDPQTLDAHITLDRAELDVHINDVSQALVSQATVEGFRKGKAPKDVALKQIDPNMIRSEALERALEDSFTKATDQEHWDVMSTRDLKVLKNDTDGLEYSVRVALWPAVTLPELGTVKVPRKLIQVSDEEMNQALETIRNMKATFLEKTGPASEGDRVEIDFDAMRDGQPVPGGSSRNHPLIIGGKSFMPGFEDALIGLPAEQKKEFSLTAPADYYEQSLAGKKIDFAVTIRRVQTVLKPTVDDAFATSLGSFENVDQLMTSIRQGIVREKEAKEHQRLRLAILDDIVGAANVPAPEAMVTEELDHMVHRFSDDLKGRGVELPMYLARLKKTEDDLRKDWRGEAERQVRITLVLRQVAKDKSIAVTPEELQAAVAATVQEVVQAGHPQEQVDMDRLRSALAQRILTDKTLDFLEGVCAA